MEQTNNFGKLKYDSLLCAMLDSSMIPVRMYLSSWGGGGEGKQNSVCVL